MSKSGMAARAYTGASMRSGRCAVLLTALLGALSATSLPARASALDAASAQASQTGMSQAGAVQAHFDYGNGLQLRFPEAMQLWDNAVSTGLVRLHPSLPLECSWTSDTVLDCRFDAARRALATRYRVEVAALRTQRGAAWSATTLYVETRRPELTLHQQGWMDGMPRLRLWSNTPATPHALARVLRLTLDGRPLALDPAAIQARAEPGGHGAWFDLALPRIPGQDRRLVVSVVPGLRSSAGPLPGTQDRTLLDALVNETFRLRGATCSGRHGAVAADVVDGRLTLDCLAGQPVELLFSQPLDAAARRRLVAALPDNVQFLGWGRGQSHPGARPIPALRQGDHARLRIHRPGEMVAFVLPENLHAADGAPAVAPARVELRAGPYLPMLQASRSRGLVAEGRDPPVLARLYNAAAVEVQEQTVAVESRVRSFRSEEAHGAGSQPLSSRVMRDALAEGGWGQWMPSVSGARQAQAVEFAAPAFDLAAVAGRREVLAWANQWDGSAPVADARVELLWRDRSDAAPRVVAQARTGADGVARLVLPAWLVVPSDADDDGEDRRDAIWLLRATQGSGRHLRRAVLPAWRQWDDSVLGQGAPLQTWGVSDRPLYRAGDEVRYRLWQRQRVGGRLLRLDTAQLAPRELQLFERDDRKTILRWNATPDAEGGLSGRLPLPVHLTDGTYCIGTARGSAFVHVEGTCFFVGTYRAQDLWAEATAQVAGVLRDGDVFNVDIAAGYYSGGVAAGIALSEVSTRLSPLPLQQAYPQYAPYTFIDVFDRREHDTALENPDAPQPVTDAGGRVRISRPMTFVADDEGKVRPPAFGEVRLVAEVRPDGREATASNAATARYSHFDRFVGLQVAPGWWDSHTPLTLQGVVIDAEGRPQPVSGVDVEVQYTPGFAEDAAPQTLTRCAVPAGKAVTCDFARTRPGRYRLLARSGDAAPAEVVRHVWGEGSDSRIVEGRVQPALELVEPPAAPGAPARVLLRQPAAQARVLFVFASGDAIVGHRVETLAGNEAGISLQTPADWRAAPMLHAFVRDAATPAVANRWRDAPRLLALDVEVPLPQASPEPPVTLTFDAAATSPGETRTLVLHNTSDTARDVVLSVMDDALRALAADYLAYSDPAGRHWLGRNWRWEARLRSTAFGNWAWPMPWTQRLPWRDGEPTPEEDCTAYVDDAARETCEAPVVFDDAGQVRALAPPAPPAPAADIGASVEGSASLDRVEVTGARFVSEETAGDLARPLGATRAPSPQSTHASGAPRMQARLRTRFADTALWLPSLRLAPGERREIALPLPDNLTRWRAMAWSSDADDGFQVAEATLEAGLPLEVRLQAPVRLYPGDRARLAANLRQTGDVPLEAAAELRVEGMAAPAQAESAVALAPRGQGGVALEIAPDAPGTLRALAATDSGIGGDAVMADIEVASPTIPGRRLQAGWLGDSPLLLDLPQLPGHAHDARLRMTLVHGVDGLVQRWTDDLQAYPHRCWEQILSRALGAALAIERGDTARWPDAQAAVDEAIANAAVFEDGHGGFRFFAAADATQTAGRPQLALTAYSVQALTRLGELGHPVDAALLARANGYLASELRRKVDSADGLAVNRIALAAAAAPEVDAGLLDALRLRWSELAMPARLGLAQAMAHSAHPAFADTTATLLAQAPSRGGARVLQAGGDLDRWMGSPMREQCALIGLLRDRPGETAARRALIAGLGDLYDGHAAAVDTQTGATCLLALRDLAGQRGGSEAGLVMTGHATPPVRLTLAPGEARSDWQGALPEARQLRLVPQTAGATPAGYIAEVEYLEDARLARESAVGFSIARRYAVLRNGGWVDIDDVLLRDGDWLRVTLVVRSAAPRHFVAVTDAVPGGLRPTDLALGAIAGLDLERVSDTGSSVFGTRRLDARTPRFYAEYLPAGEHALHYFARAGNGGDYLAAPATAELMYGGASNARTAAQRIVIEPASR